MTIRANVLAGAILVSAVAASGAQTKTNVPDAQVEASVLKALAGAPELSSQNIQTSTTYGVVTLSGNVHDEAMRSKAENLVARVEGVKKVVDEMALGDTPAANGDTAAAANAPSVPVDAQGQPLQSQADGSYAPEPPQQDADAGYATTPSTDPAYSSGYPEQPAGAPPVRRPLDNGGPNGYYNGAPQGPQAGQVAGRPVTVPPGALLQVRIDRGIDSNHIAPGTPFSGMVLNDVIGSNAVAIPRGAQVNGVVIDAKKTKELSGKGQLALQVNSVVLGGQVYPLQTTVWYRIGRDKTGSTVGHAIGLGAVGALFGAAIGGGAGAAIGAGVGATAGVAASAASGGGRVLVAPEAILTFHTDAPAEVRTVSQAEMQRLSYAAGPMRRQGPPPGYYRRGYYSPYPY
ncbi:MAG: BON domain-containing protein [Acidobacteriaceae bacterium]|nr:BON domain-containing protein [Acidobacteriaceae bacterium]